MATLSGIITPTNVETASSTSTLTNKTINGSNNTITNIPLSTGVTGTLPVANGGTGSTSTTFANLATNVTGTLPVANGGTGATTLTANNVLLGNGTSAPLFVAPSTSGNVLTSNGTTWQSTAPAGGGSLVLLQTVTGTGVSTLDVTGNFTSTYKVYKLYINCDFSSVTTPTFRLYINSVLNTGGNYAWSRMRASSGSAITNTNNSSVFTIEPGLNGKNVAYEITFFEPSNANNRNAIHFSGSSSTEDADANNTIGFGNNMETGTAGQRALTGIRMLSFTGNVTARLYGIKES